MPASIPETHPAAGPAEKPARPARRRSLVGLVAVNAALALALLLVELAPLAGAQPGPMSSRPRGDYTLVGGEIQTGNSNAVYIIDSVNQDMIVLRWEDGRNILDGVGYRDLDSDATAGGRR